MHELALNAEELAWKAFSDALETSDVELWSISIDDLQRTLRYAVAQGYGHQFREWMEAANYPDRYAPLYWAFLALLEGEDILRNVSPEVRRTAERIYRGLAAGAKPAPPPKPKKPRRRKAQ